MGEDLITRTVSTDRKGIYVFREVVPRSYKLWATKSGVTPLTMAWSDSEVILASGDKGWEGLKLVPWEGIVYSGLKDGAPGFGAVTGIVLHRGKPVVGAVVTLYLDREEGLKGPGFRRSFPTVEDGLFYLSGVTTGSYYLTARKRAGGSAGPVRAGDLFGEAPKKIEVREKSETLLTLHVVEKEKERAPHAKVLARTGTKVKGRVVDGEGKPVAGLYVFAYRERIIGHKMPDFLSETTGADGTFMVPLGEGGLFYLGARQYFGGSPRPGELFGLYGGSPDHGLEVESGETESAVVIKVHEVLEP